MFVSYFSILRFFFSSFFIQGFHRMATQTRRPIGSKGASNAIIVISRPINRSTDQSKACNMQFPIWRRAAPVRPSVRAMPWRFLNSLAGVRASVRGVYRCRGGSERAYPEEHGGVHGTAVGEEHERQAHQAPRSAAGNEQLLMQVLVVWRQQEVKGGARSESWVRQKLGSRSHDG